MKKLPEGVKLPDGRIKIATSYREETFEKIKSRAEREGKTFSEAADEVASIGLFDLDEAGE